MSAGTKWALPGGQHAIEMDGSTRDELRLSVSVPGWPFPKPPVCVARSLCKRLPMRYHGNAPVQDADEVSA